MMRGFHNRFRVEFQVVNVARLSELPESITEVTPAVLAEARVVRYADRPVKVLGPRGDRQSAAGQGHEILGRRAGQDRRGRRTVLEG